MTPNKTDLALTYADKFSMRRLAHLLNQAYADYYIPIWFEGSQFEQMCDDMDVDLSKSVIATAGKSLVGIALLSVRGHEGWVSGVGVVPPWRRRGIGRAIVQQVQQTARDSGLRSLRLEVLAENAAGKALYKHQGFAWQRDLLVLRLEATSPKTRDSTTSELLNLDWARPRMLLNAHGRCHTVEPSWQRALPSLRKRANRVQGLGLWRESKLIGYVLFQAQPDVCHIVDLGVDRTLPGRVAVARQILLTLHGMYPDLGGYTINVPAEAPLLAAYTDIGYRAWHRQSEMVWEISPAISPHRRVPPHPDPHEV